MIDDWQLRAARAAVRMTVAELAKRAGIAPNTVVRAEAGKLVNTGNLRTLQAELEAAGVTFTAGGGVEPKPAVSAD